MTLAADLKARFPEFVDIVDDADIISLGAVWPCYYGGGYDACGGEIVLNLVAHLLTTDGGSNATPSLPPTSRSVGSVSESFGAASSDTDLAAFFGGSKYGQRFLYLIRLRGNRAYFV